MTPPPEDPRDVIMRRRAAFLGSALAAASCAPASPQPTHEPTPVVSVPEPTGMPTSTGSTVPETPPPKPDLGARPPYDIPAGVSDVAKKNYEQLHKNMKELHADLDEMEAMLPACDAKKPDCEQAFRKEADLWHEIHNTLRFMYFCPGKSDDAKAFAEHQKLHDAHLRRRIVDIDGRLASAAGDPAKWKDLKAQQAKPTPCLSFGCVDW